MPFAGPSSDLYLNGIRPAIESLGLKCLRADDVSVHRNRRPREAMLEAIETSKLVVFLADGANANAYYEAGYADALRKEVVIVVETFADLKFDVRDRHAIEYNRDIKTLQTALKRTIRSLPGPS
jgi:hypothetical protein